jgi:hypothetical protein
MPGREWEATISRLRITITIRANVPTHPSNQSLAVVAALGHFERGAQCGDVHAARTEASKAMAHLTAGFSGSFGQTLRKASNDFSSEAGCFHANS